jgi:hypothetical protein
MKITKSTIILFGLLLVSLAMLFFVSKSKKTSPSPVPLPAVQQAETAPIPASSEKVEDKLNSKTSPVVEDSKTKEQQYLQEIERLNKEILLLKKKAEISKIQKEIKSLTSSRSDDTTNNPFVTLPLDREDEFAVRSNRNSAKKEQSPEDVKTKESVFRVSMTTIMDNKKIAVLNVADNDVIVTEGQSFTVGKKTYRVQSISNEGVVISDGQETYYVPVVDIISPSK